MKTKNKWLIALSGMMLQLSIGSIYAYSVWMKPISSLQNWNAQQLKLAFSLAICFLGLTAAFMGEGSKRIGPKKSGLVSAAFFSVGLLGSGIAASISSLTLFYLSYGVCSGIGLGLGYITPVSVVVKWFPSKPGFASGLVIMSFAAGSILASQVISPLVSSLGVPGAFYALSLFYVVVMTVASLYLALPNEVQHENKNLVNNTQAVSLFTDRRFYGLWLMLFLNTTCGIALIAIAAPLSREMLGIGEAAAILFVSLIGLFNGVGRLLWSTVSDRIGRWNTYAIFFLLGFVCFVFLSVTRNIFLFQLLVFVIISCYGGAFATMPAFIKDVYGQDRVGPVFGYVLTAWAAAAFAGPWLISVSKNYSLIFYCFAALLAIAFSISFVLRRQLTAVTNVSFAHMVDSNPVS